MEIEDERPSWTCDQCITTVIGAADADPDVLPSDWAEDGQGDTWCADCQKQRDPAEQERQAFKDDEDERRYAAGDDPYD